MNEIIKNAVLPNGGTGDVLYINNTDETFYMRDKTTKMMINESYIFSFWAKTEGAEKTITTTRGCVDNVDEKINSSWKRILISFVSNGNRIELRFEPGIYYLYEAQLEKGTIPTDWKMSDYDIQNAVDIKLEEYAKTEYVESKIEQTTDKIMLNVSQVYTTNDVTDKMQSTISQQADKISLVVTEEGKTKLSNALSIETDGIKISGERLEIDAENFKLDKKGNANLNNATLTGTIEAQGAIIDGSVKANDLTITGGGIEIYAPYVEPSAERPKYIYIHRPVDDLDIDPEGKYGYSISIDETETRLSYRIKNDLGVEEESYINMIPSYGVEVANQTSSKHVSKASIANAYGEGAPYFRLSIDDDVKAYLTYDELFVPKVTTKQVQGTNGGGNWIKLRDSAVVISEAPNKGSANAVATVRTDSGAWSMAALDSSESLWFSYGTNANYSANNNSTKNYHITTDGYFNGSCSHATSADTISGTDYIADKSKSVDGNAWTNLASFTLPAGKYMGLMYANVSNTPDNRLIFFVTNESNRTNAGGGVILGMDNRSSSSCTVPLYLQPSTTTTYYLRCYQASSSAQTVYYGYRFKKIA